MATINKSRCGILSTVVLRLKLAKESGTDSDPGLEEAACNDDSAHENTEKCWEGKSRRATQKQMGRNAQVCFVVGAETEAIFVGMEVEGGSWEFVSADIIRGMGHVQ